MAHTLKAALTEAATRYPQHAAYLHALIHAPTAGDSDPTDTVEWSHDDLDRPETVPHG